MVRSLWQALLAVLAVVLSVGLVTPSAQAAPKKPLPVGGGGYSHLYDVTLSGDKAEKALRSALVIKHSKNHKKRHLDWSAAKKYFDKHTTWRDDFAAGYQGGGGTLDHASASTKARLKKRWNAMGSDAAARSMMKPDGGGTNCTGVSKEVPYTRASGRSESWLDSCDTVRLITKWGTCTAITGWVSARLKGWVAAIPGAFGILCVAKLGEITAAAQNSNVHAIKTYYTRVARVGGNGLVDGQLRITATLYSQ